MRIRTLILDDDGNSRRAASTALSAFEDVEIAGQFSRSEDLYAFLQENSADLLFLDIELNEEFGFHIAKELKGTYPELLIVFLTGHSSYAVDGYDFHPVNFLTKPINIGKLEHTIEEVRRLLGGNRTQNAANLLFHLPKGVRIVDVRQICYVESNSRKIFLKLPGETLRITGYTMKDLEEMLSPHGFFLCHQSFLVNLYRVQSLQITGRQVYEIMVRDADTAVPVSRNSVEGLKENLGQLGVL